MSAGDSLIDRCVSAFGLWWPDAEEEDCLRAAAYWRRLPEDIREVTAPGSAAADAVTTGNRGEAVDCFWRFWDRYERIALPGVIDACESMAVRWSTSRGTSSRPSASAISWP